MKGELSLGTAPVDTALETKIAQDINAAVSMIDPLVRYDLLDVRIIKDVPLPFGKNPIIVNGRNPIADEFRVNYWIGTDLGDEPTGLAPIRRVDAVGAPSLRIYPTEDWPITSRSLARVTYQLGLSADLVPRAIVEGIILLARRFHSGHNTMPEDSAWFKVIQPYRALI